MHNAAALRADWMQASTAFNMRSATCRTMFAEKTVVNKMLIANKERRGSGDWYAPATAFASGSAISGNSAL
jgi:hypothetical protein